jgi:ribosome maturation protein Sdo1
MKGNVGNTKVFYQGSSEGFVIFVESADIVRKWKEDKTVPLTEVVAGWKVMTTEYAVMQAERLKFVLTDRNRHGKQGVLNTASNSQLENEFGTKKEEDVVKQILEKGDIQTSEVCCFYVPVDLCI